MDDETSNAYFVRMLLWAVFGTVVIFLVLAAAFSVPTIHAAATSGWVEAAVVVVGLVVFAAVIILGGVVDERIGERLLWEPPFEDPTGVALEQSGVLHVTDATRDYVKTITPEGSVATVGSSYGGPLAKEGPRWEVRLSAPSDVTLGDGGQLLIVDSGHNSIRLLSGERFDTPLGVRDTEGKAPPGPDGMRLDPPLAWPMGLVVGGDGSVYVAEAGNDRVVRIDGDGRTCTVAGCGRRGCSGDGHMAVSAELSSPRDVAVAPRGILIADRFNHRIRCVGADGVIRTVAGTGQRGFAGDGGAALDAKLAYPASVAAAPDGTFYIADEGNHRIRRVGPDGIISTFAGSGVQGFAGDDGRARSARLSRPSRVRVTSEGDLLVVDTGNRRVRRVDRAGVITTLAAGLYRGEGWSRWGRSARQGFAMAVPILAIALIVGLIVLWEVLT